MICYWSHLCVQYVFIYQNDLSIVINTDWNFIILQLFSNPIHALMYTCRY